MLSQEWGRAAWPLAPEVTAGGAGSQVGSALGSLLCTFPHKEWSQVQQPCDGPGVMSKVTPVPRGGVSSTPFPPSCFWGRPPFAMCLLCKAPRTLCSALILGSSGFGGCPCLKTYLVDPQGSQDRAAPPAPSQDNSPSHAGSEEAPFFFLPPPCPLPPEGFLPPSVTTGWLKGHQIPGPAWARADG